MKNKETVETVSRARPANTKGKYRHNAVSTVSTVSIYIYDLYIYLFLETVIES